MDRKDKNFLLTIAALSLGLVSVPAAGKTPAGEAKAIDQLDAIRAVIRESLSDGSDASKENDPGKPAKRGLLAQWNNWPNWYNWWNG